MFEIQASHSCYYDTWKLPLPYKERQESGGYNGQEGSPVQPTFISLMSEYACVPET
jgi:hypothetical protein